MSPRAELDTIRRLAARLRQRSQSFKSGSNNAKLLDLYLSKCPGIATNREVSEVLGGINPNTPISRLNSDLHKCFQTDRSLWREQAVLFLSDAGRNQSHRLQLRPLYASLSPSMKVWFHQVLQISLPHKRDEGLHRQEPQPIIVLSEPLFFFSPVLGAYVRFLNINHDTLFGPDETRLVREAQSELLRLIPNFERGDVVREFLEGVDLVPVRLYLPAGDSYAKTSIRRWFRNNLRHRVGYKSASAVSVVDSVNANLIVLASRSSLPLLAEFQQREPLRLLLTDEGIRLDDKMILDRFTAGQGTTLSHVIVTNWTLETGRNHTFIASNHTRAIQAVAELLVSDDELLNEVASGLVIDDKLPSKFQIAFEVRLHMHETNATVEGILPELEGRPLVY